MLHYRVCLFIGLLFYTATINFYQLNWIGLARAGIISGQVLNVVNEAPVVGALITVTLNGITEAKAITDADGYFRIPGLRPSDDYSVVAENYRFLSMGIGSVPVQLGSEVTTHFILTPIDTYY